LSKVALAVVGTLIRPEEAREVKEIFDVERVPYCWGPYNVERLRRAELELYSTDRIGRRGKRIMLACSGALAGDFPG
jgi:hypothetical protein